MSNARETACPAAIVARPGAGDTYLLLTPLGQASWTGDPQSATPFASMREAARAAFRLPANVRAYGLPLAAELALARAH